MFSKCCIANSTVLLNILVPLSLSFMKAEGTSLISDAVKPGVICANGSKIRDINAKAFPFARKLESKPASDLDPPI